MSAVGGKASDQQATRCRYITAASHNDVVLAVFNKSLTLHNIYSVRLVTSI